jgi:HD-like signal output (HDOD) protein
VGRAITVDQALAAKVLKLVNSAFYGFPGRISTITHAIVILGFNTVKNIVLTASIFDTFRKNRNLMAMFDLEQFWYHSVGVGVASKVLARYFGVEEREESFIAGLVHDIGKLIICQYLTSDFKKIIANIKTKDILFIDSEKELYDFTHQDVGGILTERWNLPQNLQFAVKYHHTPHPSREYYQSTAIVHCADIFIRALDYGNGGDSRIPSISQEVWNDFQIENISLTNLFDTIRDEFDKATVFFQLIQ